MYAIKLKSFHGREQKFPSDVSQAPAPRIFRGQKQITFPNDIKAHQFWPRFMCSVLLG